jgi:hypothetical protein
MRQKLEPLGAEFISAWDVLCDTRGCLTRTGPAASDLAYSDNVHIRETASVLLVAAVIDKVLGGTPRLYER